MATNLDNPYHTHGQYADKYLAPLNPDDTTKIEASLKEPPSETEALQRDRAAALEDLKSTTPNDALHRLSSFGDPKLTDDYLKETNNAGIPNLVQGPIASLGEKPTDLSLGPDSPVSSETKALLEGDYIITVDKQTYAVIAGKDAPYVIPLEQCVRPLQAKSKVRDIPVKLNSPNVITLSQSGTPDALKALHLGIIANKGDGLIAVKPLSQDPESGFMTDPERDEANKLYNVGLPHNEGTPPQTRINHHKGDETNAGYLQLNIQKGERVSVYNPHTNTNDASMISIGVNREISPSNLSRLVEDLHVACTQLEALQGDNDLIIGTLANGQRNLTVPLGNSANFAPNMKPSTGENLFNPHVRAVFANRLEIQK